MFAPVPENSIPALEWGVMLRDANQPESKLETDVCGRRWLGITYLVGNIGKAHSSMCTAMSGALSEKDIVPIWVGLCSGMLTNKIGAFCFLCTATFVLVTRDEQIWILRNHCS